MERETKKNKGLVISNQGYKAKKSKPQLCSFHFPYTFCFPRSISSAQGAEPVRLSKGSSNNATAVSVSVSADAVAEHARQTSMLLPGGLSVVGLFLFAPGGLSAAAGGESSLLSAWREAVRISDASGGCRLGGAGGGGGGGVLLGADASSRGRVAAKEVVSSSSSSSSSSSALSLRHAETRFAPLIPRLVSLRATYPVAAKVSVSAKEKKKKKKGGGQRAAPAPAPPPLLSDLLSAVAGAEAARARRCLALGSGTRLRPLDLDASVAESLGELGEPEAGAGGAREVVLLPPAVSCSLLPESDDDGDGDGEDEGEGEGEGEGEKGFLRLEGWVEARALVHERDSVREAVEALALDVGATVRARVAAAVEEAQEEEEEEAEAEEDEEGVGGEVRTRPLLLSPPPSSSPVVVPLARRVLFPLLPGGGGGSSAPAALVLGGDLALPPKRRRGNEQGGRNGVGVGGTGVGVGGAEEDRADGEGALDAAAQLCGRDDLVPEDLTFAEGRAEGASAAGVASSSSSPSSSRREAAAGAAAAAARAAPTTATRAPTAPSAAATATATASAMPVAAVAAVAAATLALALGAYLTLA